MGRIHAWHQVPTSWPETKARKRRPGMPLMNWSSPNSPLTLTSLLSWQQQMSLDHVVPGKHRATADSHFHCLPCSLKIWLLDHRHLDLVEGTIKWTLQQASCDVLPGWEVRNGIETIPAATSVSMWTCLESFQLLASSILPLSPLFSLPECSSVFPTSQSFCDPVHFSALQLVHHRVSL